MSEDNVKILCPYCNAEWSAQMEAELESYNEGCETCGYGSSAVIKVKIYCTNCYKLVYVKECEYEQD